MKISSDPLKNKTKLYDRITGYVANFLQQKFAALTLMKFIVKSINILLKNAYILFIKIIAQSRIKFEELPL